MRRLFLLRLIHSFRGYNAIVHVYNISPFCGPRNSLASLSHKRSLLTQTASCFHHFQPKNARVYVYCVFMCVWKGQSPQKRRETYKNKLYRR